MIIGLIGFGKVSQNLVKLIQSNNIKFITSKENRSQYTIEAINRLNVETLPTFKDVADISDILISANSPFASLEVAEKYGKCSNGIYLDLNNISPETTFEIEKHVSNLVDGAIIGKIDSDNPTMYISGNDADKLLFLNDYLNVKVISDKIGDVAILKLLRSSYTKTLTAILIESYEIAKNHNLEDEFFDVISLTEGQDFKVKSMSRIKNTLNNSKRKREELTEIINSFSGQDLVMVKAALEKFNRL
ncbi:MAG: NAD(P)-dependent oxidoreductase [Methanobrevibacter sp.]|uniref:NAD(P)-dependent oxidoreductase n=1 Tax=uncultured Methanobrevibacter sp. TaxID=253161 RepID=UPI0025DC7F61|nr:NAD(P)-dependent oxidoreductase [uncultured Methanobrevibacter sp.]MEE1128527.1 NAD(P)-dependent oxidoreductase [Methanobrevibacter sp.]